MILCRPTNNPLGVDLIGVFEGDASVRATLFKLIHFKIYVPDFDKISAAGFFDIAIENTLRNPVVSGNMVKFAAINLYFFVYF